MITSINDILSGLTVGNRVKEYGLWKAWDRMVGANMAKHCQPDRLKDGILILRVSSPVWAQQLQFMKAMILEKVNAFMDEIAVKDLKFTVGKVQCNRKFDAKPWKDMPLPQETLARIEKELSPVGDPELRDILRKLRFKEAQVKIWEDQRRKSGSSIASPS